MLFVVKLFPEITIKSRPVRRRFIRQLRKNIRSVLREIDETVSVTGEWDSIEVDLGETLALDASGEIPVTLQETEQRVINKLSAIPGIASFVLVDKYALPDMDGIFQLCKHYHEQNLVDKTFAVRCKRSGKHPFKSVDVERYVGGGLNQHTQAKGVQLVDPDLTVKIEIRDQTLYLVKEQHKGMGGFPLGTQDSVLSLISGGFDSSVSSFLTIKRGLLTHYCFFNLGGREHELAVKEVALYLWMKYGSSHRVKFVTVPFEEVVTEILQQIDDSQMGVILKRMMLRAASAVAEQLQIQALVTGESVAQVSSQTLANLAVIDSVTDTLVLRPLSTSDKQDIIDVAREIGTEEFSKNIPEYCGVISVKPTTRARPEKISREEERFNFAILEQAVANAQQQLIYDVANDLASADQREIDILATTRAGDIVIDIRHPDEEELKPLCIDESGVKVLKIPFYELRGSFEKLDREATYLLYCDKGMMSRLHAAHLRDEGFENLAVLKF